MKLIGPGAGDGIQSPARPSPIFGPVIRAKNLYLVDRIRAELHSGGAARDLVAGIHDIGPVEQEVIRGGASPGDGQAAAADPAGGLFACRVRHSGLERGQLIVTAAIEGQPH